MKRYVIYLGTQTKDKTFEHPIETIKKDFSEYFSEYNTGFSLTEQIGGYVLEDSSYIIEQSIRLSLIGEYDDWLIDELIEYTKNYFSQESLLLVVKDLDVEYR